MEHDASRSNQLDHGGRALTGETGDLHGPASTCVAHHHSLTKSTEGRKRNARTARPLEQKLRRSRTFRLALIGLLTAPIPVAPPARRPSPFSIMKVDLLAGLTAEEQADFRARFMAKVSTGPACWSWLGARSTSGYGVFSSARPNKRKVLLYAHRVAYELEVGPITQGMTIDHTCSVTFCVNPKHMQLVTPRENTRRRDARRAAAEATKRPALPSASRAPAVPIEKKPQPQPRHVAPIGTALVVETLGARLERMLPGAQVVPSRALGPDKRWSVVRGDVRLASGPSHREAIDRAITLYGVQR